MKSNHRKGNPIEHLRYIKFSVHRGEQEGTISLSLFQYVENMEVYSTDRFSYNIVPML